MSAFIKGAAELLWGGGGEYKRRKLKWLVALVAELIWEEGDSGQ